MVRRRKSKPKLQNLSIAELQDLLDKKVAQESKRLPSLKKKRDKLASELGEVESEIAAIEGSAPKRRRTTKKAAKKTATKRGRRRAAKKSAKKSKRTAKKKTAKKRTRRGGKMTLPQAIHEVLSDAKKPMRPVEIRNAIIDRKLIKNPKKSFPIQVSHALSTHKEFKKKGRGLYSL